MGAARGRFDELDQLQADLQDQLAGTEEDWDEVKTSDDWSQTDAIGEKKVITRMVRDFRSWGRKALRKIEDFRAKEIKWRQHDAAVTLQYQKWFDQDMINTQTTSEDEGTDFAPTHLKPRQQTDQLTKPARTVVPEEDRNGDKGVAVSQGKWVVSDHDYGFPLDDLEIQVSQNKQVQPRGGPVTMPTVFRFTPRPASWR